MSDSILDRVELYLEAIERHDAQLKTFITVTADEARRRAGELDAARRRGKPVGPLAGWIVALKDNIDVGGQRTTLGSGFHAERVANADAEVTRRLQRAGAVIIGKTNLSELALGATCQNPHYGSCRNPWDLDRIPGGSSGGSAAAVAAGMCDAALGTDTGGSVRIPAALTGVAGLRPTVGRVSNRGVEPVSPQFDVVGPLARTVAQVATVYEAIAGYDPEDEFTVDRPVGSWSNALPRGLSGLRIGLPAVEVLERVEPDVAKAVAGAAEVLADLGAEMRTVDISDANRVHDRLKLLIPTEIVARNRERLVGRPETFGADVRERMRLGLGTSGTDYAGWMRLIEQWRMRVHGLFETVEVILTPTVGFAAPMVAAAADMIGTTGELTRLTFVWSYALLPALSVPCGITSEGLPVGMQLVGPQWSEARLLAVGAAFQEATDFHERRPAALA